MNEAVEPLLEAAFGDLHRGKHSEALARFEAACTAFPAHPAAHTGLAEALIACGRVREARHVLCGAVADFADNPWPRLLLGKVTMLSGAQSAGRERIDEALSLGADEPEIHVAAAAAIRSTDDHAAADEVIDAALTRFPGDLRVVLEAARCAVRRSRWDQADTLWNAVLRLDPGSTEAIREIALARGHRPPKQREVVVIYGNCQVDYMCLILNLVPVLSEQIEFVAVTNHGLRRRPIPRVPDSVRGAILLWEQFDQQARVDVRNVLRAALPERCRTVRFPALNLTGLWPFACVDRRPRSVLTDRYPWGDRVAMEVAGMHLPREKAFARYMELSTANMPDIRRLLARDRAMLERRDESCDVRMTGFIFDHLRTRRHFWTWGYASGELMAELIFRLIERSQAVAGLLDERLVQQLRTVVEMCPGQVQAQLPLHPAVIEQTGIAYVHAFSTYAWFDNRWTFEEYMTRYIMLDPQW